MRMTNARNRSIYRLWAAGYDQILGRFFAPGRRRSVQMLELRKGDSVLLLGVGTGADLPLLPRGVRALGVDLSREMLAKAHRRLPHCAAEVHLVEGDAQLGLSQAAAFDAAILNLILSVVPNPRECLEAALWAIRAQGRLVIFDKFLPDTGSASPFRTLLNALTTAVGTDINRRLGDMLGGLPCRVICREPSVGRGLYQIILLYKVAGVCAQSGELHV